MDRPHTLSSTASQPRSALESGALRLKALRIPLFAKLAGANLIVVIAVVTTWEWWSTFTAAQLTIVAAAAGIVHLLLIMLALAPIHEIESVASRISHGDYAARIDRSAFADHEVLRVGAMFNHLLDGLATDRARMRALATEVIEVGDRERAAIARELHDSTAQQMAALMFQLGAAARDTRDPELAARLRDARDAAERMVEEVRVLSHTVHPGVLDDLGLAAALQRLARDSSNGNGIVIDVDARAQKTALPPNVASVLYRVAQESVRNATRHANPRRVRIITFDDGVTAHIEVHDDGRGFDMQHPRSHEGMGLRSMRERLSLVGGVLEIKTAAGAGTTIAATVPIRTGGDNTEGNDHGR